MRKIINTINKKRILVIIVGVILVILLLWSFLKNGKTELSFDYVVRGTIRQEIFESGQVTMGEKINLTFKNGGRVESIYAKVGEEVIQGQKLIKVDTADLEIQLLQAKNSLKLAQLNLDKLLAGATDEEIKIAQNQVTNAQIALELAQENFNNSTAMAAIVLEGAYAQIYHVADFLKDFIDKYIGVYDEEARKILVMRAQAEEIKDKAKELLNGSDMENNLWTMRDYFEAMHQDLKTLRSMVDDSAIYRDRVSLTDKNSLDTLKLKVNNILAEIINSQQLVSSRRLSYDSARTTLLEAENRLSLVTAESRQIDIDLYQIQIAQAQTQVQFYQNQIREATLVSPVAGKVADIKKKIGEMAQPLAQDVVVVILPTVPYEVKVNIYEEDVVKIANDNRVEISLAAFPEEVLLGKVVSINPAEKILNEVVYYEVTIAFEEIPEGIKPGMTADVAIEIDFKENVLIVPEEAIRKKEGKTVVEVFSHKTSEEKEVVLGLKGNDGMVEIISGLTEGEKIILK